MELARWPATGRSRALGAAEVARVIDALKGMLLAASNALVIAVACVVFSDRELLAAVDVLVLLAFVGIPFGFLMGMFVSMFDLPEFPPTAHASLHVVAAISMIALCTLMWPEVRAFAFPSTAVHAVLLSRWTLPRPAIPMMVQRR
jgi:hypothetical protein